MNEIISPYVIQSRLFRSNRYLALPIIFCCCCWRCDVRDMPPVLE